MTAWLLDLLFPVRCVSCGASGGLLCTSCGTRVRALAPPWCALCGAPTAWPVERCRECLRPRKAFASARAAVAYDGPARALVHAWKERGARRASALVAEIVAAHVRPPATDVITHIPPDRDRLLRRGYNPAEQLARELSTGWGALHASLLERTRPSPRQTDLSLVERRRNVRGAFVARRTVPARILLVDDVYTTGSTTSAAAAALRSAGALEVHVVTFARAVR